MKVREPVPRPLDVMAAELLVSVSQAFLVGMLVYLALGIRQEHAVGGGPFAIILALLAVAVAASWLFWLVGGIGWPLAAAALPVALLAGFVLLLGLRGGQILALEPLPVLLLLAAGSYLVVAGAFLDSPRRWRWDERARPRTRAEAPRLSPTSRAVLARLSSWRAARASAAPRGPVPDRASASEEEPWSDPGRSPRRRPWVARRDTAERHAADLADPGAPEGVPGSEGVPRPESRPRPGSGPRPGSRPRPGSAPRAAVGDGRSPLSDAAPAPRSASPRVPETMGREAGAAGRAPGGGGERPGSAGWRPDASPGVDLPTSVEPRAHRSPWAWARPPEWHRDDDDEPADEDEAPR